MNVKSANANIIAFYDDNKVMINNVHADDHDQCRHIFISTFGIYCHTCGSGDHELPHDRMLVIKTDSALRSGRVSRDCPRPAMT
jgi:hypothetical protein